MIADNIITKLLQVLAGSDYTPVVNYDVNGYADSNIDERESTSESISDDDTQLTEAD